MKKIKTYVSATLLSLLLITGLASCKKESSNKPNYGNTPRKPVPASLTGLWVATHVSGSTITYPGGRTEPTWAQGFAFTINADGTGICVVSADTHGPASETYSRVDQDCTYEITLNNDNTMTLKLYIVAGKVYENNVFLHDLAASKCYPQAPVEAYTCTLGENSTGKYFESGAERFYKR